MSARTKKIGKGKNAFSVLQSDYDLGFPRGQYPVTNIKTGVTTMADCRQLQREIARIEAIKPEIKQVKKVKEDE